MKHLYKNNVLTDLQHGFCRNRSCEPKLILQVVDINVIDDWDKCLDKGIDLFVLDFEKPVSVHIRTRIPLGH